METVEGILARMQVINDATDLTPALMDEYEGLERTLATAQRADQLRARNSAYNMPAPGQIVAIGAPRDANVVDAGLEKAFVNYLRTGVVNQDIAGLRNAQTETTTGGGYLVPKGFREKLIEVLKAFGGIANISENLTTSSGGPLEWATLDDTANTGAIAAINTAPASGGADLVFGTVTLGAYRFTSTGTGNNPLKVPVELVQDSAFDISGLVTRRLGERLARQFAGYLGNGTGSGQPQGLVNGLTGTQSAANTGITYDDLVGYIHSVDPAYRPGARWVFNDNSLKAIRLLKDGQGNPIWRPLTADMATPLGGGDLLGYPVTVDQSMPDINKTSATVNWGAFGDISQGYIVRYVQDVSVLVNPYSSGSSGQIEYSAWMRADAKQQNTAAYKALTCHV